MQTVGFIGAGQMGRPMVDRLVAAGLPTEVYARRESVRAALAADGIAVTDDAAGLASRVGVLILCLFDDTQLRSVAIDDGVLAAMRPGSVLVSHVTGSPALSVELQSLAPAGVHVLDVPVSGTADHIRAGRLTLLASGDPAAIELARPTLAAYGDPILELGALGDGQRVKLINNVLFSVNLRMAIEAARLAEQMGVPPERFATVVAECSADSFALRLLQHGRPDTMAAAVRPYLTKDVAAARAAAAEQGLDLGLLGDLAHWFD